MVRATVSGALSACVLLALCGVAWAGTLFPEETVLGIAGEVDTDDDPLAPWDVGYGRRLWEGVSPTPYSPSPSQSQSPPPSPGPNININQTNTAVITQISVGPQQPRWGGPCPSRLAGQPRPTRLALGVKKGGLN